MEPQKKRPRAVVINESSYSLNDVIGAIHNCKYFLSALYGIEDIKNSGIVAMCLILACVSKEHKSIIRVLRRAEQQFDECQAIIEEALALILQNGDNLNLILKLATSCDQAKLHKISSLFIISALRYADRYDAKDLINELTSQMTDSMTSSNFRLFDNASKEFPELICEHQRSFRIIFDHIDRLKPDNLRTFYECMIRLAVFSYIQQGDTLHWNDLLMIIRKQVSSVDPPVRMFGSVALVAMTLIIFTDEVGEAGEASCSQAPTLRRLVHQEKFIESYLELLTLALSTDNCDIPSVVHLCKEIVQILPGLNLAVIKKINRRISSLFENGFIFELQHQHQQQIHHSLDGDETLIGLGNSSMQATFMMPFVFHLLQHTEKLSNGGILDNIDALLGCPVMGPDDGDTCERISSVSLSNWIRSLINAFYDQEDKDIQSKCLLRLSLLQKCSSNMSTTKIDTKEIVNVDHESTLDLKCYDEEFLRSLNLSQKVSLSKTDTTKEILPEQLIIHLNPGVIVKYSHQTGEVREFILKEILTISKLSTWEDTDIINVLAGTKMDLQVTVHLIEELTRRESTCPLLEMINSIINGVDCANLSGDQMCCLVKLCQMVPGVDRQALISETLINFIFSPECSTPDAGQLLEGLCALHDDSVEFITLMMSRLSTSEFTVWKKKLSLHAGLSASLSRIKQEHVPVIIGGIKLFDRIVQMGRGGIETGFAEATFKYGKVFLERLTKDAIPVLQGKFLDHRQEILESFKPLQCATRSLQIMCNHLKPQRLPKYKNLLPPLKRSLEALLYGVKRLLQVNNCLSAFWIGNLKHRTIDGAETNSQVPIEISESEEEEPDVEKCDTESECDIGV